MKRSERQRAYLEGLDARVDLDVLRAGEMWRLNASAVARTADPEVGAQIARGAATHRPQPGPSGSAPDKTSFMLVNIHQAKTHLSRLVEQAAAGEEIIIGKAGRPMARAHHHGMWHRTPIPDLLIAEVRPLTVRRLG